MGAVQKDITFENLDGETVTETWYFSLDEADAAELELAHRKDIEEYMTHILKEQDSRELLAVWRELLFASVGKRVGKLLIKDDDVKREFRYGGAYKQFFAELIDMEDAGASFFNSIMPDRVQKRVAEQMNKVYSKEDMLGMSDEEFFSAFGKDETQWTREQLLVAHQRKMNNKAAA